MTSPRGGSSTLTDADGVRIVRSSRPRLDTCLIVAAGLALIWLLFRPLLRSTTPPPPPAPASPTDSHPHAPTPPERGSDAPAASSPEARERRAIRHREVVARRIARKTLPRTHGPEGKPEVQAGDAIAALRAAGVTDGIAAFNPPGTSPPRSGVIVPNDVVLPEGYLRHHQTTDDGTPLPPILLFHPDYEFFDEQGRRIEMPADLVVPPEYVPSDIPIEVLEVPGGEPTVSR